MSIVRGGGPRLAAGARAAAAGCVSIPEDERARLDAIERDWLRPVAVDDARPLTLAELQEAAIRRHPGLTATFHRYRAALQRIVLDGALDDPRVQFGVFLESVETRVGSQEWKAGVSQAFPFWGKRDLRAEIALHDAHQLREQLVEERLRIAKGVASAYWNLFDLETAIDVTERQVDLLDRLSESIEARFLSGTTPKADYLSILMEIDRRESERRNLGRRRVDAIAALNASLDRAPDAPLAVRFPAPDEVAASAVDAATLVERARDFGPVKVQAHRVLRQDAAVALAELGWYPDFSVGLDYIGTKALDVPAGMSVSGNGDDPTILGVGLNLPIWWDKNEAAIERAEQLLEAERASRRSLIRDAERRAVAAVQRSLESEEDRALYVERLLPRAEEKLELSEQDYVGGLVDLDRLIAAEREVLELRLLAVRALADRETALVELDYLTGGALGRLVAVRPPGAEDVPEAEGREIRRNGGEP
ncbi:MAG: TolC family protein [Planctomycetota bacterium JB042]